MFPVPIVKSVSNKEDGTWAAETGIYLEFILIVTDVIFSVLRLLKDDV